MQNVRHMAQNTSRTAHDAGCTVQNVGHTARNVGCNTLNVCLGPKGGLEVPPRASEPPPLPQKIKIKISKPAY